MSLTSSVGLMAIFLVDLVDMIFISMLGRDELAAAVGYAGALLFFTSSFGIGMSIAAGALVAPCVGRRRAANSPPQGRHGPLLRHDHRCHLRRCYLVLHPQPCRAFGRVGGHIGPCHILPADHPAQSAHPDRRYGRRRDPARAWGCPPRHDGHHRRRRSERDPRPHFDLRFQPGSDRCGAGFCRGTADRGGHVDLSNLQIPRRLGPPHTVRVSRRFPRHRHHRPARHPDPIRHPCGAGLCHTFDG